MSDLQVRDLKRHFGGVRALDGVSFDLAAGQCVALIGPNGAGKSTCFACLAGQQQPQSGQVLWAGQPLLGLTPAQRLQRGVARTFQVAQTFEALTVLQNLQLVLSAEHLELAMALAAWPDGAADVPRLLLLDEPAAGLAPAERQAMMALVRRVAHGGVTVLYTEHNMDAVFGVADRVLVLMQGRLVADGTPEAVAQDAQVRASYLGQDFDLNSLAV
jgi:branched-chain amino acid transport system ATP-binding protein